MESTYLKRLIRSIAEKNEKQNDGQPPLKEGAFHKEEQNIEEGEAIIRPLLGMGKNVPTKNGGKAYMSHKERIRSLHRKADTWEQDSAEMDRIRKSDPKYFNNSEYDAAAKKRSRNIKVVSKTNHGSVWGSDTRNKNRANWPEDYGTYAPKEQQRPYPAHTAKHHNFLTKFRQRNENVNEDGSHDFLTEGFVKDVVKAYKSTHPKNYYNPSRYHQTDKTLMQRTMDAASKASTYGGAAGLAVAATAGAVTGQHPPIEWANGLFNGTLMGAGAAGIAGGAAGAANHLRKRISDTAKQYRLDRRERHAEKEKRSSIVKATPERINSMVKKVSTKMKVVANNDNNKPRF